MAGQGNQPYGLHHCFGLQSLLACLQGPLTREEFVFQRPQLLDTLADLVDRLRRRRFVQQIAAFQIVLNPGSNLGQLLRESLRGAVLLAAGLGFDLSSVHGDQAELADAVFGGQAEDLNKQVW